MEHTPDFGRMINQLVHKIDRLRKHYMDKDLEPYGLRGAMYMYIMTLTRRPGISQDCISEELDIDKSNIARISRNLEDMGYITRSALDTNRRQYQVFLTEAGQNLVPAIKEAQIKWRHTLTDSISEENQKLVVDTLMKMLKNCEVSLAAQLQHAKEENRSENNK